MTLADLQARLAVPAGWKLVPVEATLEMTISMRRCKASNERWTWDGIWAAALSAAPFPPAQGDAP
jgi:hypothetical protein